MLHNLADCYQLQGEFSWSLNSKFLFSESSNTLLCERGTLGESYINRTLIIIFQLINHLVCFPFKGGFHDIIKIVKKKCFDKMLVLFCCTLYITLIAIKIRQRFVKFHEILSSQGYLIFLL